MDDYDFSFKIMMLGDASVGKTSLTIRYISGVFDENLKLTIGLDFYNKTIPFRGKKVQLQIWDFGGAEKFRFLLSQYSKGAHGAFLLYDITNASTLEHLPDWIQIVRKHAGEIPIILIGSKFDLHEFREVSQEDGIIVAKKYNLASFIELSSKMGTNIEKAFEIMTEILFERYVK